MKHSFLRQITACVDWRGIRTLLNKKYTKTHNAIGNPAYDALMMFKIFLLQTWYGLIGSNLSPNLSREGDRIQRDDLRNGLK